MDGGLTITADMVAHGVVAVSRRVAADPRRVFEPGYRGGGKVRVCVGMALVEMSVRAGRGRGATQRVSGMLQLGANKLAPSGLKACKLTLLDVSVACAAMSQAEKSAEPIEPADEMTAAKARTGKAMAARKAALQAAPFDPKALKGGKTAKAAPKFQDDPAPVRRDELSAANNPIVAADAARHGGDDRRLVEACRKAGGFPIIHLTAPLRGKVTAPDPQTWGHG